MTEFDAIRRAEGERLLPWAEVRELTGLSRTTVWRRQKAGDFPAPVVISPGRVGWRESEIVAWARSRRARGATADRPQSKPPNAQTPPRRTPKAPFERPGAAAASRKAQPVARRSPRTRRGSAANQIHFEF